jgi:DNA-binding NtrC family response regulator
VPARDRTRTSVTHVARGSRGRLLCSRGVAMPAAIDGEHAVSSPSAEPAGFARVLVVDDEAPLRHMLELLLGREGFTVLHAESAEAAIELLGREDVDVVLTDVRMPGLGGLALVEWIRAMRPGLTAIVMSAFGTIELALAAMHAGAYDYIAKPFKQDEVVLTLRKAEERERLRRENAALRVQLSEAAASTDWLGDMLIRSPAMHQIAKLVRKVAPYKTTVLVLGESGVGKELVSRAIHSGSPRADGPFVAVNCGAIPEALLESELFGHVRGAFTDASADKRGLLEEAKGGTIFLDEIGELPLALQVKLLRALQEEEVRRVGDVRSIKIDARVIAATSRDLAQMVDEGTFRRDLYFRLHVMPIEVPPLRERKDDIEPLLVHFIGSTNRRLGTRIEGVSTAAMAQLLAYRWPGNVRELENTIEHAAVMAEGTTLEPDDLPERLRRVGHTQAGFTLSFPEDDLSVKRAQRTLEREFILRALAQTDGNRTHAAKLLELSHRALLYKIKDFGLV